MDRLPSDLLQEIFFYAHEAELSEHLYPGPRTLGAVAGVCCQWKVVALDYCPMWGLLDVGYCCDALSLMISRSSNSRLLIYGQISPYTATSMEMILMHAHRIHAIRLDLDGLKSSLSPAEPNMKLLGSAFYPRLKCLVMTSSFRTRMSETAIGTRNPFHPAMPHLRYLHLQGINPDYFQPWTCLYLTCVVLTDISFGNRARLFLHTLARSCERLQSLILIKITCMTDILSEVPPIRFGPSFQLFELHYISDDRMIYLLQHVENAQSHSTVLRCAAATCHALSHRLCAYLDIQTLQYHEVVLRLTDYKIDISVYTECSQPAYIRVIAEQSDDEEQMSELHALSCARAFLGLHYLQRLTISTGNTGKGDEAMEHITISTDCGIEAYATKLEAALQNLRMKSQVSSLGHSA
jgi:hypothetical protein